VCVCFSLSLFRYRTQFIDNIVSKLKPYENTPNLRFSFIIEPGELMFVF
jgi:hypothetical protein